MRRIFIFLFFRLLLLLQFSIAQTWLLIATGGTVTNSIYSTTTGHVVGDNGFVKNNQWGNHKVSLVAFISRDYDFN